MFLSVHSATKFSGSVPQPLNLVILCKDKKRVLDVLLFLFFYFDERVTLVFPFAIPTIYNLSRHLEHAQVFLQSKLHQAMTIVPNAYLFVRLQQLSVDQYS